MSLPPEDEQPPGADAAGEETPAAPATPRAVERAGRRGCVRRGRRERERDRVRRGRARRCGASRPGLGAPGVGGRDPGVGAGGPSDFGVSGQDPGVGAPPDPAVGVPAASPPPSLWARPSEPVVVHALDAGDPAGAPLAPAEPVPVPEPPIQRTRLQRFRSWRFAPFVEVIITIGIALGLAESVQAAIVKPFVIPTGSMEPTLEPSQRVLVNRLAYDFGSPHRGDIVVFHPPNSLSCGDAKAPVDEPCPKSVSTPSSQYFVKRIMGLPGDHLYIKDGHPVINGHEITDEPYIALVRRRPRLQHADRDHDSQGRVLHARGQSRRLRRQPLLGSRAGIVDRRRGLRDLLAAGPHRHLLSAGVQGTRLQVRVQSGAGVAIHRYSQEKTC